jgi:hypothetical protein
MASRHLTSARTPRRCDSGSGRLSLPSPRQVVHFQGVRGVFLLGRCALSPSGVEPALRLLGASPAWIDSLVTSTPPRDRAEQAVAWDASLHRTVAAQRLLHGDRRNAWTKLAQTAPAGSSSIQVLDASGWRVGDEIVLASTDFDPRQAERRTISAIRANTITLDRPLEYMHFGTITFDVDQRGEVGLLTRNIRIQAPADAEQSYFGGHVMAMGASRMFVDGVEFSRMGQHLTLARYPIHWHLVGDAKGLPLARPVDP